MHRPRIAGALRGTMASPTCNSSRKSGTPYFALQSAPRLCPNGLRCRSAWDAVQSDMPAPWWAQTYAGTRIVRCRLLLPEAARHRPSFCRSLMIAIPSVRCAVAGGACRAAETRSRSIRRGHRTSRSPLTLWAARCSHLAGCPGQGRRLKAAPASCPLHRRRGSAACPQNQMLALDLLCLVLIGHDPVHCFSWRSNTWLCWSSALQPDRGGGRHPRIRADCRLRMVGLVTVFRGPVPATPFWFAGAFEPSGRGRGRALELDPSCAGRRTAGADPADGGGSPRWADSAAIGLHHPGRQIEDRWVTVLGV